MSNTLFWARHIAMQFIIRELFVMGIFQTFTKVERTTRTPGYPSPSSNSLQPMANLVSLLAPNTLLISGLF